MPSEGGAGFEPQRRLHRMSWVFVATDFLRHAFIPLLAALVLGARNDAAVWVLPAAVLLIAGALWHQWVYRYDFGPRGLVIREGLFFRNLRTIDYRRIENIDTERNLLHRLLGVAQVRVETSSGGGSEAVIRVLDLAAVAEMRQRIFAARENAPAPQETRESAQTLLRLPAGELVRFGLIDNRGMIVVAAVVGLMFEIGSEALIEQWADRVLQALPAIDFAGLGPALQAFLVLSTIAGLIAGTRVLSILLALVTLHDFRLVRKGDDLNVTYGLLTRISLTMRRPRIQAVHRKATLLHRLFRRVSLRADLAGGLGANAAAQQQGQQASRTLWLAPVCTVDVADELTRAALPDVTLDNLDWRRLSPRAATRLFRLLTAIWVVLAALPATIWFGWWALGVLAAGVPFAWLHARLYVKYTGWALHDEFFALRRGWLTRRLSVVPRNRVQSVRLGESPFDRRYRMRSLHVDTAGARGTRLWLPFLDAADARRLADALYKPGSRASIEACSSASTVSNPSP